VAIQIKTVILYDSNQHVSGFVELRTDGGGTAVKLRHNLQAAELLLSVSAGGDNHVLNTSGNNQTLAIPEVIDLSREVVTCVMSKEGNKVSTLASGAINLINNEQRTMNNEDRISATKNVGFAQEEILSDSPLEKRGGAALAVTGCADTVPTPLGVVLAETEHAPIRRKYKTEAAREIDEMLRAVCTVDDKGKGMCEICPYREHFFGENINVGNTANTLTIN